VHWKPVDEEAHKGSVSDKAELRVLFNDNAQMQCKHCGHRRNCRPTTHFKNHLLAGCLPFQATEAWNRQSKALLLCMRGVHKVSAATSEAFLGSNGSLL
jgi:hypothetical protein